MPARDDPRLDGAGLDQLIAAEASGRGALLGLGGRSVFAGKALATGAVDSTNGGPQALRWCVVAASRYATNCQCVC